MGNQFKFLNKGISSLAATIVICIVVIFAVGGILAYQYQWLPCFKKPILEIKPIDLSGISTKKTSLTKYYSLASLDFSLEAPQYNLPLKTNQITNFDDFSKKISLSNNALNLLKKNSFVVIDNPFNQREEYITQPYRTLKEREIPVFITSDSLLHLYHIQFDETLRQIEEKEFYDKIWQISKELLDDSIGKYNASTDDLKEAYKRNIAYLAVALELLDPEQDQLKQECGQYDWQCMGENEVRFSNEEKQKYDFETPDFVKEDVEIELNSIEQHSGFSLSSIFEYKEDYSQYVPRGHYTRSEKLKNYFKTFMWYGRISFLLKKDLIQSDNPERTAKIQTMAAALMASKFADSQKLKDKWDRIYTVTAFYVGLSDDLGPYEYLESLNFVFNEEFDPNDLTEENIGKLKAKLTEYRTPKIYGGTGDCVIPPPFTPEQADECLENTKGFRLMGQRFILDSYMFSNLVGAYTDVYLGDKNPFTLVISGAGRFIRGFPRGLDVMALLGSKRAKELLNELDDSNYKNYDERYHELEEEFSEFTEEEWNKNLYWAWLYALKPLLKEFGAGYPIFMQTKAWQDKELTTALSSWAELRHDTILYAKQSYTMAETALPPQEKPVVGYIEPVPEFYNRLLSLTNMTTKGLDEMKVLDEVSKSRLENLERILEKLIELSERELKNEELTQEDYDFIKNFGEELNNVIAEVDEKAKKTTIIADVHTDSNTQQVLEEGVGFVNLIVVAYEVPDGRILIGAGPVMSYYEFKHPMSDRLTDEKWRDLLQSQPPERPEWVSNFQTE